MFSCGFAGDLKRLHVQKGGRKLRLNFNAWA